MMKAFFRVGLRVLFLVVVAGLLAAGGALAWFGSWRTEQLSRLHGASSIAKTAAGTVEYVQDGEGPALLIFHGAPGGFDQAMLFGSEAAGFRVIAPSRPGYLRTPLATGLTPEKQAAAMAALLDSLGVESVAVMGVSLGAPAAVAFAQQYPQRTWAMVLVSPVTKKLVWQSPDVPLPQAVNERLSGDVGSWMAEELAERDPERLLSSTFDLAQTGDDVARGTWVSLVAGNPSQVAWFRDLVSTLVPMSPRETGLRNDLLQLRALPPIAYEKLEVPTLLICGAEDKWIDPADVSAAAAKLPNATLLTVPNTGHIVNLGPSSADLPARIREFLGKFHGGQGAP